MMSLEFRRHIPLNKTEYCYIDAIRETCMKAGAFAEFMVV